MQHLYYVFFELAIFDEGKSAMMVSKEILFDDGKRFSVVIDYFPIFAGIGIFCLPVFSRGKRANKLEGNITIKYLYGQYWTRCLIFINSELPLAIWENLNTLSETCKKELDMFIIFKEIMYS